MLDITQQIYPPLRHTTRSLSLRQDTCNTRCRKKSEPDWNTSEPAICDYFFVERWQRGRDNADRSRGRYDNAPAPMAIWISFRPWPRARVKNYQRLPFATADGVTIFVRCCVRASRPHRSDRWIAAKMRLQGGREQRRRRDRERRDFTRHRIFDIVSMPARPWARLLRSISEISHGFANATDCHRREAKTARRYVIARRSCQVNRDHREYLAERSDTVSRRVDGLGRRNLLILLFLRWVDGEEMWKIGLELRVNWTGGSIFFDSGTIRVVKMTHVYFLIYSLKIPISRAYRRATCYTQVIWKAIRHSRFYRISATFSEINCVPSDVKAMLYHSRI